MANNTSQQHALPKIDLSKVRIIEDHTTLVNGKIRDVIVMESDTHFVLVMFSAKTNRAVAETKPEPIIQEDDHVE